ncbi:MAG: excinuclease ABC subunit A, partial [Acidobacteria bacterium]|nr:excinuclease ABC subunit A [Acidobacteriota bacterium]
MVSVSTASSAARKSDQAAVTRPDLSRLVVKGAREHNLRNVDLDLPRDAMIVFTGLSGSGKSSLAFDTIFAEGQRRYVESLSAYARQFLGQVDKPDVDFIEGLSPAVSIDQKSTSKNPRSTVGTITEIYDYMRLLWARVGRPHCPICGEPVTKQTPQQIVDQLLEMPESTRFQVLAPVVRARKGEFVDLFRELAAKGYSRAKVDGNPIQLSEPPKLGKQYKHTIEVVVDRLVVKEGISQRLTDSVETALGLAEGRILAELVDLDEDDDGRIRAFSENLACPNEHPLAIDEIEPRSFSFNNPFGACPACSGIGTKLEVDEELVVPNPQLSLREGAIAPWSLGTATTEYWNRLLEGLSDEVGFSMDVAWEKLSDEARQTILHGKDHKVVVQYRNRFGRERKYSTGFEGAVQYIHRKHLETESDFARDRYEEYMRQIPCPACNGARLNPASLSVLINGHSIAAVSAMPMRECAEFLNTLTLTGRESQIASQVLKEIQARLKFLLDVGLDYLNLERASATLSGGEAQRIRLATQIGSGLVGVLYVL